MQSNHISLMCNHISKMSKMFKTVLIALSLIELVLIIRGLILFDLERLKLRLYLFSYIFLFVSSLVTLIVFHLCENNEKRKKANAIIVYVYAFCFIMWSAVVTTIDCYANGDSGIMVYVMTCIAVGVLTLIKPWVFLCYMGISGTFLLVMTAILRDFELYSSGFYINFFIFLLTATFVNNHNYRLSKREYEASLTLEKLSYTDQLTNVYNRRRLDQQMASYTADSAGFIFILLDIDDFKQVNDTYGHPEGDRCLVELAKMLTESFGDDVYRFGGDEFAVISHDGLDAACEYLDKTNGSLLCSIDSTHLHISAGIYVTGADDTTSAIFSKADRALYKAKAEGKARFVLYREKQ